MSGDESPWIRGDLQIRREVLDEIYAHARAEYPSECCGFVTGPAAHAALLDTGIREKNEADRYHALDPERFPWTSRMYFKMHEIRAAKAFERGAAAGQPVKVIYHSHCDAGDYFSQEDAATFASAGQLTWPCAFLVVSVMEGEPVSHRLWVHRPGSDEFDEAPIAIVD